MELLGYMGIMLVSSWMTEQLANFVPAGRWRKLLVPVPVILVLAMATLAEVALIGGVTWEGFGRAFVAGLLTIVGHNVRQAGEQSE